jgi:hypothetical protein
MTIGDNINELLSIMAKYALVFDKIEYVDYLSKVSPSLILDLNEFQLFEKQIHHKSFLSEMGSQFGKPISMTDSVKILRIAKGLFKSLEENSSILIPTLIIQMFPNKSVFKEDLYQILTNITNILKIPINSVQKIRLLMEPFDSFNNFPSLIIQKSELSLNQQIKQTGLIVNKSMNGFVRLLMIDKNNFLLNLQGNDSVFINNLKISTNKIFLFKKNENLIINNIMYSSELFLNTFPKSNAIANLYLKETELTPKIAFNSETNFLEIIGKSVPEDPWVFYSPLLSWLDTFILLNPKNVNIVFQLEYFNTTSSKMFLEIMRKAEMLSQKGCDVCIDWYYEEDDIDLFEAGETYAEIVDVKFNLLKRSLSFGLN